MGNGEHCSAVHAREGDLARSAAEAERRGFDATDATLIGGSPAFVVEEEIELEAGEEADAAASFPRSQVEMDKQTVDADGPLFDEKDAVDVELSLPADRAGSTALDDDRSPFERRGL